MLARLANKLIEKAEDAPPSKLERKEEATRRRTGSESVVSSTSARKPSRGDDRDRGFQPISTSYSSSSRSPYPGTAAPSVASSYATAASNQADVGILPPDLVGNDSMADQLPRSKSGRDERDRGERRSKDDKRRRDTYDGHHVLRGGDRDEKRDRRDKDDKREKRHDRDRGERRKSSKSDSKYRDERESTRAGPDEFAAQVHSSGFTQFPGQYDGGLPGFPASAPKPPSPGLSSHVPDQFPGQFPSSSTAPYRPPLAKSEGGPGLAAEYYGDTGESVLTQPGVRPVAPIINAAPHLHAALAQAAPPPEPSSEGHTGAAASFFDSNEGFQTPSPQPSPKPSGIPVSGAYPGSSSQQDSYAPTAAAIGAAAMGYAAGSFQGSGPSPTIPSDQGYRPPPNLSNSQVPPPVGFYQSSGPPPDIPTYQGPQIPPTSTAFPSNGYHSASAPIIPTLGAAAVGAAAGYMMGEHSSSQHQESITQHNTSETFNVNINSQPPGIEPLQGSDAANVPVPAPPNPPSQSSNIPLFAGLAGAAGLAAAAYTSEYHDSASNSNSANQPNGRRPGSMLQQHHRHHGPVDKFVDFFRDSRAVGQYEDYSEYMGWCKYCFEPGTTSRDAPRKHYYGRFARKTSTERFGASNRVDKRTHYGSDSDSRRKNKKSNKSWIAAGLAGAGLAKVGESLFVASHDFEDTYSVKTGEYHDSTSSLAGRHGSIEVGVTDDSRVYRRESDENQKTTYKVERRSRSRSRERKSGLAEVAIGAAIGSSVAVAASSSRRRSRSPKKVVRTENGDHRLRHSPSAHVEVHRTKKTEPGNLGGFFDSPSERDGKRRAKKKSKNTGFFNFGNGSSSSTDSDLAFGTGHKQLRRKPSKVKENGFSNTALLGLTAAAAAAIAAEEAKNSKGKRKVDLVAVKEKKGKSKQNGRKETIALVDKEEEQWVDASEEEEVDYGLAYGLHRRRSQDSLRSDSSGTDKWSWRWGSKKEKKKRREETPSKTHSTMSGALTGVAIGTAAGVALSSYEKQHSAPQDSSSSLQPLRYTGPMPVSESPHYDGYNQPILTNRPGPVPLQHVQPIAPISTAVYTAQVPYTHAYTDPVGAAVFPQKPFSYQPTSYDAHNQPAKDVAIASIPGSFPSDSFVHDPVVEKKQRRRNSSPSFEPHISGPKRASTVDGVGVRFALTEQEEKRQRKERRRRERGEENLRKDAPGREGYGAGEFDKDRWRSKKSSIDKSEERVRREDKTPENKGSWAAPALAAVAGAVVGSAISKREDEKKEERGEKRLEERRRGDEVLEGERQRKADLDRQRDFDKQKQMELEYQRRKEEAERQRDFDRQRQKEADYNERKVSSVDESDQRSREEAQTRIAAQATRNVKRTPSPAYEDYTNYGDFFAPEELRSKKKAEKGATDTTEPYVVTIEPPEHRSGPPSSIPYTFPAEEDEDPMKMKLPLHLAAVPVTLALMEPTPPGSRAGSVLGDTSPVIEPQIVVIEPREPKSTETSNPDSKEFSKSSDKDSPKPRSPPKVSFGQPETHEYEVITPMSSHDEFVEPSFIEQEAKDAAEREAALKAAREVLDSQAKPSSNAQEVHIVEIQSRRTQHIPGEFGDDLDFTATVAAGLERTGFDPAIVVDDPDFIRRSSPPGSEKPASFYQQPFVETVSDLDVINAGLKRTLPRQTGFVIGEVTSPTEQKTKVEKRSDIEKETEPEKQIATPPVDVFQFQEVSDSDNDKAQMKRSTREEYKASPPSVTSLRAKEAVRDQFYDASEAPKSALNDWKVDNDQFSVKDVPLPEDDNSGDFETKLVDTYAAEDRDVYESPPEDVASTVASGAAPEDGFSEERRSKRKKSKRKSSDYGDAASPKSSYKSRDDGREVNGKSKTEKKGFFSSVFGKSSDDKAEKSQSKASSEKTAYDEDEESRKKRRSKERRSRDHDDNDVKSLPSRSQSGNSESSRRSRRERDKDDADGLRRPKRDSTGRKSIRDGNEDKDIYDRPGNRSSADLSMASYSEPSKKSRKNPDKDEQRRSRSDDEADGELGRATQNLPTKSRDKDEQDLSLNEDDLQSKSFLGERQGTKKPPDLDLTPLSGYPVKDETKTSPATSIPQHQRSRSMSPLGKSSTEAPFVSTEYEVTFPQPSQPRRLSMVRASDSGVAQSPTSIPLVFRNPQRFGTNRSTPSTPLQSPQSVAPLTPRTRRERPKSSEFKVGSSNEFRPLFLVERHSYKDVEEEPLPALPSSHSTSRSSSVHEAFPDQDPFRDYKLEPTDKEDGSRIRETTLVLDHRPPTVQPDILGSEQSTPTASFQAMPSPKAGVQDEQEYLAQLQERLYREALASRQTKETPPKVTYSVEESVSPDRMPPPSIDALKAVSPLPPSQAKTTEAEMHETGSSLLAKSVLAGALVGSAATALASPPNKDTSHLERDSNLVEEAHARQEELARPGLEDQPTSSLEHLQSSDIAHFMPSLRDPEPTTPPVITKDMSSQEVAAKMAEVAMSQAESDDSRSPKPVSLDAQDWYETRGQGLPEVKPPGYFIHASQLLSPEELALAAYASVDGHPAEPVHDEEVQPDRERSLVQNKGITSTGVNATAGLSDGILDTSKPPKPQDPAAQGWYETRGQGLPEIKPPGHYVHASELLTPEESASTEDRDMEQTQITSEQDQTVPAKSESSLDSSKDMSYTELAAALTAASAAVGSPSDKPPRPPNPVGQDWYERRGQGLPEFHPPGYFVHASELLSPEQVPLPAETDGELLDESVEISASTDAPQAKDAPVTSSVIPKVDTEELSSSAVSGAVSTDVSLSLPDSDLTDPPKPSNPKLQDWYQTRGQGLPELKPQGHYVHASELISAEDISSAEFGEPDVVKSQTEPLATVLSETPENFSAPLISKDMSVGEVAATMVGAATLHSALDESAEAATKEISVTRDMPTISSEDSESTPLGPLHTDAQDWYETSGRELPKIMPSGHYVHASEILDAENVPLPADEDGELKEPSEPPVTDPLITRNADQPALRDLDLPNASTERALMDSSTKRSLLKFLAGQHGQEDAGTITEPLEALKEPDNEPEYFTMSKGGEKGKKGRKGRQSEPETPLEHAVLVKEEVVPTEDLLAAQAEVSMEIEAKARQLEDQIIDDEWALKSKKKGKEGKQSRQENLLEDVVPTKNKVVPTEDQLGTQAEISRDVDSKSQKLEGQTPEDEWTPLLKKKGKKGKTSKQVFQDDDFGESSEQVQELEPLEKQEINQGEASILDTKDPGEQLNYEHVKLVHFESSVEPKNSPLPHGHQNDFQAEETIASEHVEHAHPDLSESRDELAETPHETLVVSRPQEILHLAEEGYLEPLYMDTPNRDMSASEDVAASTRPSKPLHPDVQDWYETRGQGLPEIKPQGHYVHASDILAAEETLPADKDLDSTKTPTEDLAALPGVPPTETSLADPERSRVLEIVKDAPEDLDGVANPDEGETYTLKPGKKGKKKGDKLQALDWTAEPELVEGKDVPAVEAAPVPVPEDDIEEPSSKKSKKKGKKQQKLDRDAEPEVAEPKEQILPAMPEEADIDILCKEQIPEAKAEKAEAKEPKFETSKAKDVDVKDLGEEKETVSTPEPVSRSGSKKNKKGKKGKKGFVAWDEEPGSAQDAVPSTALTSDADIAPEFKAEEAAAEACKEEAGAPLETKPEREIFATSSSKKSKKKDKKRQSLAWNEEPEVTKDEPAPVLEESTPNIVPDEPIASAEGGPDLGEPSLEASREVVTAPAEPEPEPEPEPGPEPFLAASSKKSKKKGKKQQQALDWNADPELAQDETLLSTAAASEAELSTEKVTEVPEVERTVENIVAPTAAEETFEEFPSKKSKKKGKKRNMLDLFEELEATQDDSNSGATTIAVEPPIETLPKDSPVETSKEAVAPTEVESPEDFSATKGKKKSKKRNTVDWTGETEVVQGEVDPGASVTHTEEVATATEPSPEVPEVKAPVEETTTLAEVEPFGELSSAKKSKKKGKKRSTLDWTGTPEPLQEDSVALETNVQTAPIAPETIGKAADILDQTDLEKPRVELPEEKEDIRVEPETKLKPSVEEPEPVVQEPEPVVQESEPVIQGPKPTVETLIDSRAISDDAECVKEVDVENRFIEPSREERVASFTGPGQVDLTVSLRSDFENLPDKHSEQRDIEAPEEAAVVLTEAEPEPEEFIFSTKKKKSKKGKKQTLKCNDEVELIPKDEPTEPTEPSVTDAVDEESLKEAIIEVPELEVAQPAEPKPEFSLPSNSKKSKKTGKKLFLDWTDEPESSAKDGSPLSTAVTSDAELEAAKEVGGLAQPYPLERSGSKKSKKKGKKQVLAWNDEPESVKQETPLTTAVTGDADLAAESKPTVLEEAARPAEFESLERAGSKKSKKKGKKQSIAWDEEPASDELQEASGTLPEQVAEVAHVPEHLPQDLKDLEPEPLVVDSRSLPATEKSQDITEETVPEISQTAALDTTPTAPSKPIDPDAQHWFETRGQGLPEIKPSGHYIHASEILAAEEESPVPFDDARVQEAYHEPPAVMPVKELLLEEQVRAGKLVDRPVEQALEIAMSKDISAEDDALSTKKSKKDNKRSKKSQSSVWDDELIPKDAAPVELVDEGAGPEEPSTTSEEEPKAVETTKPDDFQPSESKKSKKDKKKSEKPKSSAWDEDATPQDAEPELEGLVTSEAAKLAVEGPGSTNPEQIAEPDESEPLSSKQCKKDKKKSKKSQFLALDEDSTSKDARPEEEVEEELKNPEAAGLLVEDPEHIVPAGEKVAEPDKFESFDTKSKKGKKKPSAWDGELLSKEFLPEEVVGEKPQEDDLSGLVDEFEPALLKEQIIEADEPESFSTRKSKKDKKKSRKPPAWDDELAISKDILPEDTADKKFQGENLTELANEPQPVPAEKEMPGELDEFESFSSKKSKKDKKKGKKSMAWDDEPAPKDVLAEATNEKVQEAHTQRFSNETEPVLPAKEPPAEQDNFESFPIKKGKKDKKKGKKGKQDLFATGDEDSQTPSTAPETEAYAATIPAVLLIAEISKDAHDEVPLPDVPETDIPTTATFAYEHPQEPTSEHRITQATESAKEENPVEDSRRFSSRSAKERGEAEGDLFDEYTAPPSRATTFTYPEEAEGNLIDEYSSSRPQSRYLADEDREQMTVDTIAEDKPPQPLDPHAQDWYETRGQGLPEIKPSGNFVHASEILAAEEASSAIRELEVSHEGQTSHVRPEIREAPLEDDMANGEPSRENPVEEPQAVVHESEHTSSKSGLQHDDQPSVREEHPDIPLPEKIEAGQSKEVSEGNELPGIVPFSTLGSRKGKKGKRSKDKQPMIWEDETATPIDSSESVPVEDAARQVPPAHSPLVHEEISREHAYEDIAERSVPIPPHAPVEDHFYALAQKEVEFERARAQEAYALADEETFEKDTGHSQIPPSESEAEIADLRYSKPHSLSRDKQLINDAGLAVESSGVDAGYSAEQSEAAPAEPFEFSMKKGKKGKKKKARESVEEAVSPGEQLSKEVPKSEEADEPWGMLKRGKSKKGSKKGKEMRKEVVSNSSKDTPSESSVDAELLRDDGGLLSPVAGETRLKRSHSVHHRPPSFHARSRSGSEQRDAVPVQDQVEAHGSEASQGQIDSHLAKIGEVSAAGSLAILEASHGSTDEPQFVHASELRSMDEVDLEEHQAPLPNWSSRQHIATYRDSGVHVTDSPQPSTSEPASRHHSVRDSGYQGTEPSPSVGVDLEHTRDLGHEPNLSVHESLRSAGSENPLHIEVEVDPTYGVAVNAPGVPHDAIEVHQQRTLHEDGDYDRPNSPVLPEEHPREPSLVDSTTKPRSSELFQSSPSTRDGITYQSLDMHSSPSHKPAASASRSVSASELVRTPIQIKVAEPKGARVREVASLFGGPVGVNTDVTSPPTTPAAQTGSTGKRRLNTISENGPEASSPHKHTRDLADVGAPEHGVKTARHSWGEHSHSDHVHSPAPPDRRSKDFSTDDVYSRLSWPAVDEDNHVVDLDRNLSRNTNSERRSVSRQSDVSHRLAEAEKRSVSGASVRSIESIHAIIETPEHPRSVSGLSNRSGGTPPLRRVDSRSVSSDLRAAKKLDEAKPATNIISKPAEVLAKEAPAPVVASSSTYDPVTDKGKARIIQMAGAEVYEGWGDVPGSPRSPSRPQSVRQRQSFTILNLEQRLNELVSENRLLTDAKTRAERSLDELSRDHGQQNDALREALRTRDLYLSQKDAELNELRSILDGLHKEVAKLTEVNEGLTATRDETVAEHQQKYSQLEEQHATTHQAWQDSTRELDELRDKHSNLAGGMESIVAHEISVAMEKKNQELQELRDELEDAKQQVRALQRQILATRPSDDLLSSRDEDYFETQCQQLCQHVQQWVLRFSKFSDMKPCRRMSEINDDKIIDRFDNAILDGSDVDIYLADRVKRRDVFMSVVMTMVWEYVFTRYLFGMDREQRQKLKALEKTLSEVGPITAVNKWRAMTLTLLSRREAFLAQRENDTLAVVEEIYRTLAVFLPPPSQLVKPIQESLLNVMRAAVDLSIEMRTQKAEYMMLPPLQPEYDTNGDLVRKVYFNPQLMNERSGDTTSNEELGAQKAVVRMVLFPLVVKKGDDDGQGGEEIVVCPAQVLVAKDSDKGGRGKAGVRGISAQPEGGPAGMSVQSFAPSSMVPGMGNVI